MSKPSKWPKITKAQIKKAEAKVKKFTLDISPEQFKADFNRIHNDAANQCEHDPVLRQMMTDAGVSPDDMAKRIREDLMP